MFLWRITLRCNYFVPALAVNPRVKIESVVSFHARLQEPDWLLANKAVLHTLPPEPSYTEKMVASLVAKGSPPREGSFEALVWVNR